MKKYYSLRVDGGKRVTLPNGKPSKYFFIQEFRNNNPNVDQIAIDNEQVAILEKVREKFGPVFIQIANRDYPTASYHNPNFGNSCATDFDIGNNELGTVDYYKVCEYMESIGAKEIGCYDYNDLNGKHTHFIHMDMGGRPNTKKFWTCTKINPDGTQKLDHIKTFVKPPLIPFPEPKRTLRWIQRAWIFRMHGNDVRWLQTALNLVAKKQLCKVDGDFAGETHALVRAFQASNKIDIDGVAGPATIEKLKQVLGL